MVPAVFIDSRRAHLDSERRVDYTLCTLWLKVAAQNEEGENPVNVQFNSKSVNRLVDVFRRTGAVTPARAFLFDAIKKKVLATPITVAEVRTVDLAIDEVGLIGALLDPKVYPPTFDNIDGYPELISALGLAESMGVAAIAIAPSGSVGV